MSNKYILKKDVISQVPELEIDKKRFEQLKTSKLVLSHAFAIEEKYEIIISNFLELEREATNITISEMVRDHTGYKDFFDIRLALNIRLVNLLTSVRLYTDQLSKHIYACTPYENIKAEVQKLFANEYDTSFEYRFMEALRNYVQHSGIPVHRISGGSEWIDSNDELLEYSLFFGTQKKEILLDGNFKKQVLSEMPNEVNLRAATRSYIEAISRVHNQARRKIEETVNTSRLYLDQAIRDYEELYKQDPIGLYAYEYQDEKKVDEVPILTKWDDVRRELVKRNRELVNLRKKYVTSQAYNK